MGRLADKKMAELDIKIGELEDKSKEEILDHLRKVKQKEQVRHMKEDWSTSDLLEKMIEHFDLLDRSDCSKFTLKKTGMIKVLLEVGAFDKGDEK